MDPESWRPWLVNLGQELSLVPVVVPQHRLSMPSWNCRQACVRGICLFCGHHWPRFVTTRHDWSVWPAYEPGILRERSVVWVSYLDSWDLSCDTVLGENELVMSRNLLE
jgi:hypothetical protein